MTLMTLLFMMTTALADEKAAVIAVLRDFHQAASVGERARYFGHLTEDAVFLGTDATERWTKTEFEAKYGPYMDAGKGWTYLIVRQNVTISTDGQVAWFDEDLTNDSYGACRGTGVLIKQGEVWRIAQYNLTFPVPNELAREVVARIRELEQKQP